MYILIPIIIFYSLTIGIALTVVINTYLIPYLGLGPTENMPMIGGMIIVGILATLYFLIFGKKLESEKFKRSIYDKFHK